MDKEKQEAQELARRIRKARKEAHFSQATLGSAIGVSDKSVSAYEMGRSIPPFEKLKKIAIHTNRPLTYFTQEQTDELTIISKLASIEQELQEIRELLKKSQK